MNLSRSLDNIVPSDFSRFALLLLWLCRVWMWIIRAQIQYLDSWRLFYEHRLGSTSSRLSDISLIYFQVNIQLSYLQSQSTVVVFRKFWFAPHQRDWIGCHQLWPACLNCASVGNQARHCLGSWINILFSTRRIFWNWFTFDEHMGMDNLWN